MFLIGTLIECYLLFICVQMEKNKTPLECKICAKPFSTASNLNRHDRTVHQKTNLAFQCQICSMGFTRKDNLQRHEKQFHKTESSTTITTTSSTTLKRSAEPDSIPSSPKQMVLDPTPSTSSEPGLESPTFSTTAAPPPSTSSFSPPPPPSTSSTSAPPALGCLGQPGTSSKKKEKQLLSQLPSNIQDIYRKNWDAIKTHRRPGKHQSVYTHFWQPFSAPQWDSILDSLFSSQRSRFKINYSHSFVLRHKENGQLSFYHACSNNNPVLKRPAIINNRQDFLSFLSEVQSQDHLEYAQLARPNSRYVVEAIASTSFYVSHLHDFPI